MAYYPDIRYPNDPEFPTGHENVPIGDDLYTVISAYLDDFDTAAAPFRTYGGNIELNSDDAIQWAGTDRIALLGGEIHISAVQISSELITALPSLATVNITGDCDVTGDLIIDGGIAVSGAITLGKLERAAHKLTKESEPADPADNHAVIWYSNGTGYGDDGDLCCKTTEGSTTTSVVIDEYVNPTYLNGARGIDVATIGGTEYAFVTAYDDDALNIIDVSTPASPALTAIIRGAGSPNYLGKPGYIKIYTVGGTEYAFVAAYDDDALSIFDVSTPASPSHVATMSGAGSPNYLGGAYGVDVVTIGGTEYALVASYDDKRLVIIDVSTPASPSLTATYANGTFMYFPATVEAQIVDGVETACVSGGGYCRVDISTPWSPSLDGGSSSGGYGVSTVTIDTKEYACMSIGNGMKIYYQRVLSLNNSISGSGAPNFLGGVLAVDIETIGGTEYAFVACNTDSSLTVIDISDPPVPPSEPGSLTVVSHLAGSENYLYGARMVKIYTVGGTEYAFVTSSISDALAIIDVSDPTNISRVGQIYDIGW